MPSLIEIQAERQMQRYAEENFQRKLAVFLFVVIIGSAAIAGWVDGPLVQMAAEQKP